MPATTTRPSSGDIHDLVAVGFGPASLALAIALVEHNSNAPRPEQPTYSSLGGLQEAIGFSVDEAVRDRSGRAGVAQRTLKCAFVERFPRFLWHPGMMLEGSTMQISFLKDLATLRNPQSAYTFLSYLASFTPSRLASFISLSTFTPSRREFADYLQWCAKKVQGELEHQGSEVAYGEEVISVDALRPDEHDEGAEVRVLKVTSRRTDSGETTVRFTRNLVISAGGTPKIPPQLCAPELVATERIMHSASFQEKINDLLPRIVEKRSRQRPLRFAVVGAGQSSAECFLHLRTKLAPLLPAGDSELERPQIDMLLRSSSLRPTDEGQFSNEVFDPSMSQAVYRLGDEERERVLGEAKSTNYSIVNPRTLEAVYEAMYGQKVDEDIAARSGIGAEELVRDPRLNIRPYTELREARADPSTSAITLSLFNPITRESREVEYDAIVCGTGYDRQGWRNIMFPPSSRSTVGETREDDGAIPLAELFEANEQQRRSSATSPRLDLPEAAFSAERMGRSSSLRSDPSSSSSSPARFDSPSRFSVTEAPSTAATSPPAPSSPARVDDKGYRAPSPASSASTALPAYPVAENYRLQLPTHVKGGHAFKPTVWLQGSCEKTHGISDSLLSVLAVRSGEVVQSLLREGFFDDAAATE
ncbi:uncharacterized protein JCM10292_004285 [Rhodotorula paludigena]|uniref:uncharacterized protein n=1 Tax=Rhodotorula paludigena TaxID=86838 RepID=UPI00317A14CF